MRTVKPSVVWSQRQLESSTTDLDKVWHPLAVHSCTLSGGCVSAVRVPACCPKATAAKEKANSALKRNIFGEDMRSFEQCRCPSNK